MHETLKGKLIEPKLRIGNLLGLGASYRNIYEVKDAITYLEEGLSVARAFRESKSESALLRSLGLCYSMENDFRESIKSYEQAKIISRSIGDQPGACNAIGNIGQRYLYFGDVQKAFECFQEALAIANRIADKRNQSNWLTGLGTVSYFLGDTHQSIYFYNQALEIAKDMGNRSNENMIFSQLSDVYLLTQEYSLAIDAGKKSLSLAIELGVPAYDEYASLAKVYLFCGDINQAFLNSIEAQKYDTPDYYCLILHGIITLRLGDTETSRQFFTRVINQADKILNITPEYYDALDAKGLALCGLALTEGDSHLQDDTHLKATEAFHAARKIAPHAGVVKSVLRLFDELAKCDEGGVLKEVRMVIEGS